MKWKQLFDKHVSQELQLARRRAGVESVIFARLTPHEYEQLMKARLPYSGATGSDADPKIYNGIAPYIASFANEVPKALRILKWKRPVITHTYSGASVWQIARAGKGVRER